eukprot:gene7444-8864_t
MTRHMLEGIFQEDGMTVALPAGSLAVLDGNSSKLAQNEITPVPERWVSITLRQLAEGANERLHRTRRTSPYRVGFSASSAGGLKLERVAEAPRVGAELEEDGSVISLLHKSAVALSHNCLNIQLVTPGAGNAWEALLGDYLRSSEPPSWRGGRAKGRITIQFGSCYKYDGSDDLKGSLPPSATDEVEGMPEVLEALVTPQDQKQSAGVSATDGKHGSKSSKSSKSSNRVSKGALEEHDRKRQVELRALLLEEELEEEGLSPKEIQKRVAEFRQKEMAGL